MIEFAPIRQRLFGISPDETKFDRRGFPHSELAVQRHLETAGRAFIDGYNTALSNPNPAALTAQLNRIDDTFRGFAFEGAAMALALLDLVTPWDHARFQRWVDSPAGDAHLYLLYVGAGWGMARVPWARRNLERTIARYHPLYGWLTLDGFGFHQGFFYTRQYVDEQKTWPRLSPQAAQVFDQGLGRSMWFSQGGNPARIGATIAAFPERRRADLWSGVGLGSSYAGGAPRAWIEDLRDRAGEHAVQLAQGAAFAAKARQRAGNPVPHTELACNVYCRGMSADDVAGVSDACLANLPTDGEEPAYQAWRARIREHFACRDEAAQREASAARTTVFP